MSMTKIDRLVQESIEASLKAKNSFPETIEALGGAKKVKELIEKFKEMRVLFSALVTVSEAYVKTAELAEALAEENEEMKAAWPPVFGDN